MQLVFYGHDFKYEVESLCKLFFPCVKCELIYDSLDFLNSQDDFIFTRVLKKCGAGLCYAYVRVGDKTYKKSVSLKNGIENFEKECEISLCTVLYKVLSKCTGITPEWGILTGIRPVKRIQKYISDGMTDDNIINHLSRKYLVSENKARLGIETAKAQRPILKTADNFSYSLYVAIPFCPSRCSYCSFISQSAADKNVYKLIPEYLECLYKELEYTANIAKALGLTLKTVYIGGGTPTVLSAEQLAELTEKVAEYFDFSHVTEYTVEAGRPDSISEEKLRAIKSAGATRISINPQTLNDEVLQRIGRKHTSEQFFESFELARKLGFNNINTDFIAGLPKDDLESFYHSIDSASRLSPENITVHTLAMKKAARIYENAHGQAEYSGDTGKMVEYARNKLSQNGYRPYYLYRQKNTVENLENVGYAKPGFECVYNVYIMEETHTILACGASASTKLVNIDKSYIERVFNYKYPFEYIRGFDAIQQRKKGIIDFYAREFNKSCKVEIPDFRNK